MKSTAFEIARVNRLRQAAERARDLADQHQGPSREGWFESTYNSSGLIRVFATLRLKPGFALRAYQYDGGIGRNGILWAVPTETSSVTPEECPDLEFMGLDSPPRPPRAVPLMQAIEGDETPWSYLSASILRREAAEFGAFWHGLDWTPQTILSKPPKQVDGPVVSDGEGGQPGEAPASDWTWHSSAPKIWEPTVTERGATRKVVLHIYNPVGGEHIYRATDTYRADTYDCTTKTKALCSGSGGFCY